jgi:hypothetical protein
MKHTFYYKPTILLFACFIISASNLYSQKYFSLHFDDFGVDYKPTKIPDTAIFNTLKAYPRSLLKIYMKEEGGKSYFELYDYKKSLILTGYYSNSPDTLCKYKFSKSLGLAEGKKHYRVALIKYLQPLPSGLWSYFNGKGKLIRKIEYQFTHD